MLMEWGRTSIGSREDEEAEHYGIKDFEKIKCISLIQSTRRLIY